MGFSIDIKRGSVGPVQPLTPPPGTAVVGGVVANQNAGVDLSAHVADADPHPQYTTDAEATALADAAVAAHVAEADPHPQYALASALAAWLQSAVFPTFLNCGAVQIVPADIIDGGAHNETYTLDTYDGGSL